ncbi:NLR family CARD domain-containing protein 3-like [Synchiropus splendidus]|uniref:NLR family CARD domain-containing protein 3-like n=1 Tax=Synchiropus splendidus TaxID=270530 RepID=UPI00237EB722|nr:NLR family CARD domain-containing protein 3-like [Synchiropus splendidus]
MKRGDLLSGGDSAETGGPEQRDPPCKQPRCEDHDDRTRSQRSELHPEPPGPGSRPGPSCVSVKDDHLMAKLINLRGVQTSGPGIQREESEESGFCCDSLKSDASMFRGIGFNAGLESSEEIVDHQGSGLLSGLSHVRDDSTQQRLEDDEDLWSGNLGSQCGRRLKRRLQKKFHSVFEGVAKTGNSVPLNQIYTELYITEGGTDEINQEHEVRQIETATRNQSRPETTIRQEDLFKASPDRDGPIRSLLTKGVAGIGKTFLTQKLTLDWAEDKAHQNFHLMFPFTFRELNLLKERKLSLVELVHLFFPETKESGLSSFEGVQVLIILDGLDECRLPLDFSSWVLTEASESASVDVLLTNLIRGNLLPSAHIWITTRPAAASQIPPECVDMATEVRGFTDLQKEEYFRKRFKDEEQTTIISHIRSSRSLYIMCHIPIFCWITATVLEDALKSRETGELPKTLTEMYIHFLVVQAKVKKLKYDAGAGRDDLWTHESRKMIESLGKLAFEQLQRGNLIFYESDLKECGINITAASLYSGVFTQIFREEIGLYQNKVFCFVHLSLQEFLAALHVQLTFTNSGANLLDPEELPFSEVQSSLEQFYQIAVVQTLESPNGHLDLFLRFLLGLSLETNQTLLKGLLAHTGSSSCTNENTSKIIKKKIGDDVSPERTINLFHCLNELKDTSLVEEVQQQLRSGRLSRYMSHADWSAVAFILLSSEEHLDVFDLNKYTASEDAFLRLLPVVRASNKVLLRSCWLSERSCPPLSSVLSSLSSSLTQLDLSGNNLHDSGVKFLCTGLESPHCHLETLSLSGCGISEEGCASLASALTSNPSHLRELDLSYNHPGGPGLQLLSAGLGSSDWRLDTLRLRSCGLSERSCPLLSSVLSSSSSRLMQLDLSGNDLQDSGVKFLSAGLQSPHCHLETLSLSGCVISEEGCTFLASALTSNPSHLRELDLSYNHPGGPGLQLLSAGLESSDWRLDTLRVDHGGEQRLRPGPRKYACPLTLDPDTAHRRLVLSSNNRTVRRVREDQSYPEHPDRFNEREQLMCREVLTGRCYWEVERSGGVYISVTSRRIRGEDESFFGGNDQSWSLSCSDGGYISWHDGTRTKIQSNSISKRVGVLVDCPAGSVSFYRVSSDALNHVHTFFTSFTRPLYPGFTLGSSGSSATLCDLTVPAAAV